MKPVSKNYPGLKYISFSLALALLLTACVSMGDIDIEAPPALEMRTLRISPGLAGFEYQYRECVKKGFFGRCREWANRTEFYDLTLPAVREKLINMGFVAKVREKVLTTKEEENAVR